ncbi:hypothetical protein ACFQVD_11035 [Streptosporangium amethystogenes subsp. fukuiense]|uniref:Helix-turn-helix domain-containing protein n=1 Tax=Streptosporangium amethystogenes subsp. fukuiense TaxID=698418 RepID=A0ABW2SYV1_9ACTN
MSIRQAKPPSDHFTRISNLWIRDLRLSWKARGLLAWLTSHATGFRVSEKTIVCAAPDGRDAARTAIAELETYGYLVRERARGHDGRLGGVTYIICDPWSPQPTADESAPENPLLAPTSTNTLKPQAATYAGKTNAGKPARIRRPAKQEDQTPEKISENPSLLAVGEPADRRGPGTAPTPAANPEELSRTAAELLGKLPDHYRRAPAWLRSRLLKRISEALLRHSPSAIADYCAKFVDDPAFGDYEHLRRFDDVLRKLAADIADGTACPGCGHDPRHPFCDTEVGDKAARPGSEVPRIRPARRNRHRSPLTA